MHERAGSDEPFSVHMVLQCVCVGFLRAPEMSNERRFNSTLTSSSPFTSAERVFISTLCNDKQWNGLPHLVAHLAAFDPDVSVADIKTGMKTMLF